MIKHIVLLDLPADYDRDTLAEIMQQIASLQEKIPGFDHFEHGVNKDFEGMSESCAYAFICHFRNEDTSRQYIVDPDHNAFGQRLVEMCNGGVEGITVVDMALAA